MDILLGVLIGVGCLAVLCVTGVFGMMAYELRCDGLGKALADAMESIGKALRP